MRAFVAVRPAVLGGEPRLASLANGRHHLGLVPLQIVDVLDVAGFKVYLPAA